LKHDSERAQNRANPRGADEALHLDVGTWFKARSAETTAGTIAVILKK
jgi:hypothetical protein